MKLISAAAVQHKKVLVRVDFNISFDEQGNILDDFRIQKTLPTLRFLQAHEADKIILLSHLGRPKPEDKNNPNFSLQKIASYLEGLIGERVYFLTTPIGNTLKQEIAKLPTRSFILLENLRFYQGEEENKIEFARQLSELGEVFINEAFSVSHRFSASLCSVPKFLPSYAGFLLQSEIEALDKIKKADSKQLVVVMGGAKIKDKLPLIHSFLDQAKLVLIGGALANTIIKAWDFEAGLSLVEEEMIKEAQNLGSQKAELVLPGDYLVLTSNKQVAIRSLGEVLKTDTILDLGPISSSTYAKFLSKAQLIFWNGPLGKVEDKRFRKGTQLVMEAILNNRRAQTVIGGGDTLASIKLIKPGYQIQDTKLRFFSTGGGALLEYLSGKILPGLKALN